MTVLGDVTPEMTAFRQELFGPVAAITVAKNAEHALALANDSDFGLSATVFTADDALAQKMASRPSVGVFINGYSASDARVAFGGVKKSGFTASFHTLVCMSFVMYRPSGKTASDGVGASDGAPALNSAMFLSTS